MNWLKTIVEQHAEYESPIMFWWWSAITAISAVVKDNVWINRGGLFDLYPNIYTILYADSGLKKGPPISMAKQLVKEVGNTKIISGRSSIQGILSHLARSESKPGGMIEKKSAGFICASELSSSLVRDEAALDILTDLYDRIYHGGGYDSILKQESFTLVDPTVSLLGGINEAHADALFSSKDIKGGYIGRSFIIHESKRNKRNSLINKPEFIPNYKESAKYLKELSVVRGPFEDLENTPVGELFHNWYNEFIDKIEEQKIKDPTGTLNRFSESVMKVAMLISLADSPNKIISIEHMREAIDKCETLIGNVRKTTMSSGRDAHAQEKALVINELITREAHTISRQQLNKKYYMHASATDWDDIMRQLEIAGSIEIQHSGVNILYIMPDEIVEEWRSHLRGK